MDYSPWSSKNLIDQNWLKKIMQVEINIKCMHTSFGGCGFSSFGDMATFQKQPNFPFGAWTGHQKIQLIGIGSKNYASRDSCQVHAHQLWWVWSLRFRR